MNRISDMLTNSVACYSPFSAVAPRLKGEVTAEMVFIPSARESRNPPCTATSANELFTTDTNAIARGVQGKDYYDIFATIRKKSHRQKRQGLSIYLSRNYHGARRQEEPRAQCICDDVYVLIHPFYVTDQITYSFFYLQTGSGHQSPGLWRHPDDQSRRFNEIEHWVELAKLLESAKFHGIFIADVLGIFSFSMDINWAEVNMN